MDDIQIIKLTDVEVIVVDGEIKHISIDAKRKNRKEGYFTMFPRFTPSLITDPSDGDFVPRNFREKETFDEILTDIDLFTTIDEFTRQLNEQPEFPNLTLAEFSYFKTKDVYVSPNEFKFTFKKFD